jgi:hypothetical protein
MKPFVENAFHEGRYILPIRCEGFQRSDLNARLAGTCIVAYSLPKDHSLAEAWQFRIHFDSGTVFEFSALCTGVGGWDEMGSLCIREIANEGESSLFGKTMVEPICVAKIECLVHEDTSVYSEAGIVFQDANGEEVIVAAGVAPGSVSISAPFSEEAFEPELFIDDYARLPV